MKRQEQQSVHTLSHLHKTLLDHVPFWQGMGFILMICLVWAVYLFELPQYFFSKEVAEGDWFGLSLITAVIIVMGFVIVAHSYVQQRRVLKGIISVCSYCKKVRVKQGVDWMQIEHYVSERSLADFSHSVCPDCYKQVMQELDQVQAAGGWKTTEQAQPAQETTAAGKE